MITEIQNLTLKSFKIILHHKTFLKLRILYLDTMVGEKALWQRGL